MTESEIEAKFPQKLYFCVFDYAATCEGWIVDAGLAYASNAKEAAGKVKAEGGLGFYEYGAILAIEQNKDKIARFLMRIFSPSFVKCIIKPCSTVYRKEHPFLFDGIAQDFRFKMHINRS